MLKHLTSAVAVFVALVVLPGAVAAQDDDSGTVERPTGTISAEIRVSAGAFTGGSLPCRYKLWTDELLGTGTSGRPTFFVIGGVRFAQYLKTCAGAKAHPEAPFLMGVTVLVPWVTPGGGPPTWLIDAAADKAIRSAPKPDFRSAPPDLRTYVKVGMWFWTATPVDTVQATAQVMTPGGVRWATVTATPKKLVFYPGDGELGTGPVTCRWPGEQWVPSYEKDAASECMYTYPHSSVMAPNGQTFIAELAIDWEATFTSWANSTPQFVDTFTTTTRLPGITVKEIHAVVTG